MRPWIATDRVKSHLAHALGKHFYVRDDSGEIQQQHGAKMLARDSHGTRRQGEKRPNASCIALGADAPSLELRTYKSEAQMPPYDLQPMLLAGLALASDTGASEANR